MIRAFHVANLEVIIDEYAIFFFEIDKRVYHLGEFVVNGRIIFKVP